MSRKPTRPLGLLVAIGKKAMPDMPPLAPVTGRVVERVLSQTAAPRPLTPKRRTT